jgi:hypothetical protein
VVRGRLADERLDVGGAGELRARLARLETKVALEQLLRVAPEYRLRDIDFGSSMFIRGPERGIVEVGVRASS